MRPSLQVLSENSRARVHEQSLHILGRVGVRVDTAKGRQLLGQAGAEVDESTGIVRLPKRLIEESLEKAPKEFSLGARRPGWDLRMNAGECTLLVDGEGTFVLDRETGERRASTFDDWLQATHLIEAIDEIGVYWSMVERGKHQGTAFEFVHYWRHLLSAFSKHIQDAVADAAHVPWLLEVLQVVFGDKETIRRQHPFSFLLCPMSPLVVEGPYTDAYLETLGWDVPAVIMPMPLMGATAPGSLISTLITGNCEVLAMICLIQTASPGTPVIYAPVVSVMDPRTGRYAAGAVENGLLSAGAAEMGRFYGLPVEASGFGSGHHAPGIQAGYERALNGLLPLLTWPDIFVGPGLLGGSMILSLEQILIDVEVFRICKRAHEGIGTSEGKWLQEEIFRIGPGGNFLSLRSTADATRNGEWYISKMGVRDAHEAWEARGRPMLMDELRERVDSILRDRESLPLSKEAERELERIEKHAADRLTE